MTESNARFFQDYLDRCGATLIGRRLFDLTGGWGGKSPNGAPVVVLTHRVPQGWPREDAPFEFVTEGIEAAVRRAGELAGDELVAVNGGEMTRQCLDAGLLDEIWVGLAPVLLGDGVPFFGRLAGAPIELEDPVVQPGKGITHLTYRVRRAPVPGS
jgi:dihydrofolate reductase